MTDIYSISQPLTNTFSQVFNSSIFQSMRDWGGRNFSFLKNVPDLINQNPSLAIATIISTNLLVFSLLHTIQNHPDQLSDGKELQAKSSVPNTLFIGGSISLFNLLLSKIIEYPQSPWLLVTINIAAIATSTFLKTKEDSQTDTHDASEENLKPTQQEFLEETPSLSPEIDTLEEQSHHSSEEGIKKTIPITPQKDLKISSPETKSPPLHKEVEESEEKVKLPSPQKEPLTLEKETLNKESEENEEELTSSPQKETLKTSQKAQTPGNVFDRLEQIGRISTSTSTQKKKRFIHIHGTPKRHLRPIPFSLPTKHPTTSTKGLIETKEENKETPLQTPKKEEVFSSEETSESEEIELVSFTPENFSDYLIKEMKKVIAENEIFSHVEFDPQQTELMEKVFTKLSKRDAPEIVYWIKDEKKNCRIIRQAIQAAFEIVLINKLEQNEIQEVLLICQNEEPSTPLKKSPISRLEDCTDPSKWSDCIRSTLITDFIDSGAQVTNYCSQKTLDEWEEDETKTEELGRYKKFSKRSEDDAKKIETKIIQNTDDYFSGSVPQYFYKFKDNQNSCYYLTVTSVSTSSSKLDNMKLQFLDASSKNDLTLERTITELEKLLEQPLDENLDEEEVISDEMTAGDQEPSGSLFVTPPPHSKTFSYQPINNSITE